MFATEPSPLRVPSGTPPAMLVQQGVRVRGDRVLVSLPSAGPAAFQGVNLSMRGLPPKGVASGTYMNVLLEGRTMVIELEARAPFGLAAGEK